MDYILHRTSFGKILGAMRRSLFAFTNKLAMPADTRGQASSIKATDNQGGSTMRRTVLIASVSVLVGAGSAYLLLPTPETRYVIPTLEAADADSSPLTLRESSARGGTS